MKDRWVCIVCFHVYEAEDGDPEHGIPKGTPFAELPPDWSCPRCHISKDYFDSKEDD